MVVQERDLLVAVYAPKDRAGDEIADHSADKCDRPFDGPDRRRQPPARGRTDEDGSNRQVTRPAVLGALAHETSLAQEAALQWIGTYQAGFVAACQGISRP
jgi:hypothetical protein